MKKELVEGEAERLKAMSCCLCLVTSLPLSHTHAHTHKHTRLDRLALVGEAKIFCVLAKIQAQIKSVQPQERVQTKAGKSTRLLIIQVSFRYLRSGAPVVFGYNSSNHWCCVHNISHDQEKWCCKVLCSPSSDLTTSVQTHADWWMPKTQSIIITT